MKYLILIALFVCGLAQAESLKVLSWNIYMLPKPIKWSQQIHRAHAIGDQLAAADYDVIFFQEAFSPPARGKIWRKLRDKFGYESGTFKKYKFGTAVNSGLWALSKYPLKVLDHIYFDKCMVSDCFATKGALLIELQLPHRKLQVVGTHLQAWPGITGDNIRYSQLTQIKALLDIHKTADIDQVVMGDLNFSTYVPAYLEGIQKILDVHDTELIGPLRISSGDVTNSWTKPNDDKELLDYVLLRNDSSTGAVIKNKMLVKRVMERKGKAIDLSDHYGIEANIEFPESEISQLP